MTTTTETVCSTSPPGNQSSVSVPAKVEVDAASSSKPISLGRSNAKSHLWFADLILLLTALLWGANLLVVKVAIGDFNLWVFNASRLVLTTITLGLLVAGETYLRKRRRLTETDTADQKAAKMPIPWGTVIVFSAINGFFYLVAFMQGIDLTTAGNAALILASMPMWTALLSYIFLSERLPAITWVGFAVTVAGTLVVTTQSHGEVSFESKYFVGNMIMLLSAVLWATGTVVSRPILKAITPLQLAFISSAITMPLHVALVAGELHNYWDEILQPNKLVAIIYSGVFSTGIAYATWHAGVRAVGGSHAAVYQNVITLVAVLGGWIFLHEAATLAQIIGGGFTIAGLLLMRRGRS